MADEGRVFGNDEVVFDFKNMIPYGRQHINKKDARVVEETLYSDWLTQGPKVAEFERKLASYCGARYAVAVSNGTTALHLAYLVAGIQEGDEVITTPNTFVATSNMLVAIGAKPVFCDIRLDTYNIDENKIEKLITKKTKAIVPVHFAGAPCEMDKILAIAKRHKLVVIEDACHALGASYKKKKIGGIADMTVFSFHPVKSITTGEGGAILTNSEEFYKKLLLLRSHGIAKDKNGFNIMTELGYNYRLTDFQAALGASQLSRLDEFVAKRHKVVAGYRRLFGDCKDIILPLGDKNSVSSWHIYVVRVKNPDHRLPIYNFLRERGVGVNFHYPAVYSHPYYRSIGYKNLSLPNTETYHNSCITLPLHQQLKNSEMAIVVKAVKDYFSQV